MESHHDGIFYKHDQCSYIAKTKVLVEQHVESQHEVVFYHCDQCSHKEKTKGSVKQHVNSKSDCLLQLRPM